MTADQACVLGKEIIIGKHVACILYLQSGKDSVVVVPTHAISDELREELIGLGRGRGAHVSERPTEIRIV